MFVNWPVGSMFLVFFIMYFVAGYLEYIHPKGKKRLGVFIAIWFGGFFFLSLF
ncbi:hypothetical protein OAJ18_02490 [Pelagibacteraceae bacterium]|nr:hypothetical protein [Pelagibacteraceae bacterium]